MPTKVIIKSQEGLKSYVVGETIFKRAEKVPPEKLKVNKASAKTNENQKEVLQKETIRTGDSKDRAKHYIQAKEYVSSANVSIQQAELFSSFVNIRFQGLNDYFLWALNHLSKVKQIDSRNNHYLSDAKEDVLKSFKELETLVEEQMENVVKEFRLSRDSYQKAVLEAQYSRETDLLDANENNEMLYVITKGREMELFVDGKKNEYGRKIDSMHEDIKQMLHRLEYP
ncbi:MAG: hypothetical protein WCI77_06810 [Candidatus Omnitrophota bacterium]